MPTITASEARKSLFPLLAQINEARDVVRITSQSGNGVLMSEADFEAWQTTLHLLSTPANVDHLLESIRQWQSGDLIPVDPSTLDDGAE